MIGGVLLGTAGCASTDSLLSKSSQDKRPAERVAVTPPASEKKSLLDRIPKPWGSKAEGTVAQTGPYGPPSRPPITPDSAPKSPAPKGELAAKRIGGAGRATLDKPGNPGIAESPAAEKEKIVRVADAGNAPPAGKSPVHENPLFRRNAPSYADDPFLNDAPERAAAASPPPTSPPVGQAGRPGVKDNPFADNPFYDPESSPAGETLLADRSSPGAANADPAKVEILAPPPMESPRREVVTPPANEQERIARLQSLLNSVRETSTTSDEEAYTPGSAAASQQALAQPAGSPFVLAKPEPPPAAPQRPKIEDNPFLDSVPAADSTVETASPTSAPAVDRAPSASPTPAEEARLRADALMVRARMALRQDSPEDALRLAQAAEDIEKTTGLAYAPHEERPSDFVKRLKRHSAGERPADTVASEISSASTETASAPVASISETPSKPAVSLESKAFESKPVEAAATSSTPATQQTPTTPSSRIAVGQPAEDLPKGPAWNYLSDDQFFQYRPRKEETASPGLESSSTGAGLIERTGFDAASVGNSSGVEQAALTQFKTETRVQANRPSSVALASVSTSDPADSNPFLDGKSLTDTTSAPAASNPFAVKNDMVAPPPPEVDLLPEVKSTPATRFAERRRPKTAAAASQAEIARADAPKEKGSSGLFLCALGALIAGIGGFFAWRRLQIRHYSPRR